MSELVRYDAMCAAIDAAYEVDEVKDIRDKALAIEVYTRQAQNIEAERKAVQIRLRAERKAGELLRDREKAKGNRNDGEFGGRVARPPNSDGKTLAELGISKGQNSQWQKLAAVPKDDFEAELAIEVYTRQAQNIEAERKAVQIRLRAERKAGELLRDREKAKGNRNDGEFGGRVARPPNSDGKTLAELGILKGQNSQWQKLAAVPKDDFEAELAIEVYTRQAQNIEAERKAVQIRLRAERKAGELLRDREKAKGNQYVNSARSNGTTEQKKTLAELGISKDQSSQWQKLAAVPKDDFEAELAIEVYTRQAQNIEAERKAVQIRLRAERKAGELLRDREKAKGNRNDGEFGGRVARPPNSDGKTLAELGISKGQNSQWQKLAAVPKDDFEAELAIEVYTRQAQNIEAERKAVQIRLRAERKAGELLRDREKAKGNQYVNSARSNGTTEQKKTLAELGISKDQSSQWQKLAAVPKDDFEAELAGPDIPTTAGIIAKASRSANPAGGRR